MESTHKFDKKNIEAVAALTSMQEGMLFHYLKDPGNESYLEQLRLELVGKVDVDLLRRAWDAVVQRHGILRTCFRWENVSQPVQVVMKTYPVQLRELDRQADERFLEEDREEGVDLAVAPFRVTLCRKMADRCTMILTFHHILLDGWSTGIILRDFFTAYNRLAEGRPTGPGKSPQYIDFIKAVNQRDAALQTEFWKSYLSGYEQPVPLGDKKAKPASYRRYELSLNPAFVKRIDDYSAREKVTPAALFYSAWGLLLHTYCNTRDVVFGTTVSGRSLELDGIEEMAGLMIQTPPLRMSCAGGETLGEVARRIGETLTERQAFEHTPLVKIASYAGLPGNASLFQTIVVIENFPIGDMLAAIDGLLRVEFFHMEETAHYDLSLGIAFAGGGANLSFQYREGVLEDYLVRDIGQVYKLIIRQIVSEPVRCVRELKLIPQRQKAALMAEWQRAQTYEALDRALPQLFFRQAEATPDALALVSGQDHICYRELRNRVRILAPGFSARQTGGGKVAALCMERSPELVVALLAAMEAGHTVLPIDPALPPERIAYMLQDSGAALAVAGERGVIPAGSEQPWICVDDLLEDLGEPDMTSFPAPVDNAYIIYTSGSTGKPKGILARHRGVANVVSWFARRYKVGPGCRVLQMTTITFDPAMEQIFSTLLFGGILYLSPKELLRSPEAFAAFIKTRQIEIINFVPQGLEELLPRGECPESLRAVISGGEALSETIKDRLLQDGYPLYNHYGPTETTIDAVTGKCIAGDDSIGNPVDNTFCFIVNPFGSPVPPGAAGELWIGGEGVAAGYMNQPEKTAEVFIDWNWRQMKKTVRVYKTGDLARLDRNGQIQWLGRLDRQVKIRGFRVELGEIETILRSHKDVRDAAVILSETPGGEKIVDAFVVITGIQPSEERESELRDYAATRLPLYMVPSRFVFLGNIPRNANGKADRLRLRAPAAEKIRRMDGDLAGDRLEALVAGAWRDVLGIESPGLDDNYFEAGGNSLNIIRLRSRLQTLLKCEIAVTTLFQYPTIRQLARHLAGDRSQDQPALTSPQDRPVFSNEIAVIGMAGRFPAAENIRQFWNNLESGKECITFFSAEELTRQGVESRLLNDPCYVPAKGVLEGREYFDAGFFGYAPKEAFNLDPQVRVFHECAWEALEDAGVDPLLHEGAIGLYAGATLNPLWLLRPLQEKDAGFSQQWEALQYCDKDYLCSRVSYKLNLRGPVVLVSTACSTSLTAVDLACRGLAAGACDMALAGGVSVTLQDQHGYMYQEGMILAPDGHCRAFAADAGGTVGGNGAGVVVLERLDGALRRRRRIYALVKGSATNNDGSLRAGFTAPSVSGQAAAILKALAAAGVEAASVGYVEAHGTGTKLGDPIEIAALSHAFGKGLRQTCAVGSVKSNIGHLDAAAGIAGFIKTVLTVYYGKIPPSLHAEITNREIDFANSPFFVNSRLRDWDDSRRPRRAGVSSFGIGGTNVHVILEEYSGHAVEEDDTPQREFHLLPLSAKSPEALARAAANLAEHLKSHPYLQLPSVAYTLQAGRSPFRYRQVMVSNNLAEAGESLESGNRILKSIVSPEERRPSLVFMFPGQGVQYVGMGRELYRGEPLFRKHLDRCFEILTPLMGFDPRYRLFPHEAADTEDFESGGITSTDIAQPLIVAVEYSLARVLMDWGIRPAAMIGHSIGEYVAACLAGVLSLEEALRLVTKRGRLMQELPIGVMLSVSLEADNLAEFLGGEVSLAAVNSSERSVLSGPEGAIAEVEVRLQANNIETRRLHTSHAFHSHMMEPIHDRFLETVSGVKVNSPQIPYISNLTGTWIKEEELAAADYWWRHLRGAVKFAAGAGELLALERPIFLEVGPGNALSTFVRQHKQWAAVDGGLTLNMMRRPREKMTDGYLLQKQLGMLWLRGQAIDWEALHSGRSQSVVSLPTYPFQRQRFPISSGMQAALDIQQTQPYSGKKEDMSQWFYIPSWQRLAAPKQTAVALDEEAPVLIFASGTPLDEHLRAIITKDHCRAVWVTAGDGFLKENIGRYRVCPSSRQDSRQLLDCLEEEGFLPRHILHLCGIDGSSQEGDAVFFSLGYLASELGKRRIDGVRLVAVTRGVYEVSGFEPLLPKNASALGPLKVIPQEIPAIRCVQVDLDEDSIVCRTAGTARQLYRELFSLDLDPVLAYRGGYRWAQSYRPLSIGGDEASPLRQNGTYLISGGLGRIGLLLAGHLARRIQARLVLTGRSGFPVRDTWGRWLAAQDHHHPVSRKIRLFLELEAGGAEISVFRADAGDLRQMQAVADAVEERYGRLDGVIHAAGIIGEDNLCPLDEMDDGSLRRQFQAKVRGVEVLSEVLAGRDYDFCLLMSSTAAVLGGLGFGVYAAANSVMDAFAHAQNRGEGPRWISVNWDGWDLDAENGGRNGDRRLGATVAALAVTPEEGCRAFERILSAMPAAQVVQSAGNLDERVRRSSLPVDEPPAYGNRIEDSLSLERPHLSTAYAEPKTPLEKIIAGIWKRFFGLDAVGVADDFFELGGDSLKATILLAKMHQQANIQVSLKDFFKTPTIEGISVLFGDRRQEIYEDIRPVEKQDCYPLSSAQKRLFFLDRFEEIGASYNMPTIVKLEGPLDQERLENAFRCLITRHESLRTSFHLLDDRPVQRVWDTVEFAVELLDNRLLRDFVRPFDLAAPPLMRAGLLRRSDNEYILIVDLHHIVGDGTSMTNLVSDFSRLYVGDRPPDLAIQYKDFCHWQNRIIESFALKSQQDYWLERFSGDIPRLHLPADRPRPAVFDFSGRSIHFSIPASVTGRLKAVAGDTNTTLFMNLLAAYYLLLHKYTGQCDIVVGASVAGRRHADLQPVIGMFVNALAMRAQVDENDSYRQLLEHVKQVCIEGFENQDVQFEELVDRLDPRRDPARNPIFDVALVVQNFEHAVTRMGDVTLQPLVRESVTSKFDLTLFAVEMDGELHIEAEFYAAIFDVESIRRLTSHFAALVEQIAQQPALSLRDLRMTGEDERERLLNYWNNTGCDYPREASAPELFDRQVEETPDRVAVEGEDGVHLTYRHLQRQAQSLAGYLRGRSGAGSQEPVGIMMDNSPQTIIAIFGILAAGAAYVPLDPSTPEERLGMIVKDASIGTMLSSKKYIRILNRLQWDCRSLRTYLCLDSRSIYSETETESSQLMDEGLWDYVAGTAEDDVSGGGWTSSYTGQPFSRKEMDEYADNVILKLKPFLHERMRVLEIGCASGITMYRIAPQVAFYCGTDLSSGMIRVNRERVEREQLDNIDLCHVPAHRIETIPENRFDLIVINSVIQSFHGHHYLRQVLRQAVNLLGEKGFIFVGDVMDQALKHTLIRDLEAFKGANTGGGFTTKTDWSTELFVSRDFFRDLAWEIPEICSAEFSEKLHTVENELTKYRYDVILRVDKKSGSLRRHFSPKQKQQHDWSQVEQVTPIHSRDGISSLDLAYVIYTSGTTGRPKGVMVNHRSLVNYIWWGREVYLNGLRPLFPLYTTLSFDLTVTSVYLPLLSGGGVKIYSARDGEDRFPLERVLAEGVTDFVKATPSHLKMFLTLDTSVSPHRCLRGLIVGGEELESALAAHIQERFGGAIAIYNEYGPTEATVGCMIYRFDASTDKAKGVPIGGPAANTNIALLDCYREPVPVNAVGEIYIGGECLARGYLNRPELTAEKFLEGDFRLYRSGDLACRRPDGVIEYWGRRDDQVKIRGYRIEISEVENRLLASDTVKDGAVVAREKTGGDPFLCAYLVVGEGYEESALREHLGKSLPSYMIPQYIVTLDQLPVTVSGKLDRHRLPEPEGTGRQTGYIPPKNHVESALCDIWAGVLGLMPDQVGTADDFFALGGHSLRATVVIAQVHRELGVKVPLGELFKRPTISQLGQYIMEAADTGFSHIPAVEKREYYPLSSAQKRLFFLHRFHTSAISYNMPVAVKLEGELHLQRLRDAFRDLVLRHESLRTSFHLVKDEPVQRVLDRVSLPVEQLDEGDLASTMTQFVRPFDLSQAPSLRVGVRKLGTGAYLLFLDMHHIIGDGVSIANLIKDFSRLYSEEELDRLVVQYKDFVLWKREVNRNGASGEDMNYWLETMAGDLPVLALPTDFPRPKSFSYRGAIHRTRLDQNAAKAFKRLAAKNGTTVFMALMAVLQTLLHRYTGQNDIIVGTGTAGRHHPDAQDIVGMFVNSLPIRCFPERHMSFLALLSTVRQTCIEAFERQDVQFEKLLDRLNVTRDLSRSPVFDVCLMNQNFQLPNLQLPSLTVSPVEFDAGVAKLDMTIYAHEEDDEILLEVEYCSDLFHAETIRRFTSHFQRIVERVSEEPGIALRDIPLVTEGEQELLLQRFNSTEKNYGASPSIHGMFRRQAELTPHRIALADEAGHSMTYRRFDRTTDLVAGFLAARGVKRGDLVGLSAKRSIEMVTAILGILKAGAAYLPIDPAYPAERIGYILDDSRVSIVLCGESHNEAPRVFPERDVFSIEDCRPKSHAIEDDLQLPDVCGDDLAYVLYTSGSTGRPKGVLVDHGPAVNILCSLQELYPVSEGDVYLFRTPYIFDISVTELFGWFMGGGALFVPVNGMQRDPRDLLRIIRFGKVTHMNVIPSQFQVLLETASPAEMADLGFLRYIFSGGEAVLPETVRRFHRMNHTARMENLYGPTEATVYASWYPLARWTGTGNVPIGSPLGNVKMYILDRDSRLQPLGVVGELCIGGVGLARGYLNKPELTAEKFLEEGIDAAIPCRRVYRTGDLARWFPDGTIEFLGRMDHQVKIRGFRIELGEIEGLLLRHPAVQEAVVVPRSVNGNGDSLCAYILPGRSLEVSEIRDYCAGALAEYMVPSHFMLIDRIPRTANGKVDRKSLPAPAVSAGLAIVSPRTDIERRLAGLWAEVLGLETETFGIDCNFFKIGGHSLRAAVLSAKVSREFDVDMPLEQIFKTPTVRGLAKFLAQGELTPAVSPEPIEKRDYYPLSSAQKRMYVLQQMEPQSATYHLPQLFSIGRDMDLSRLQSCFRQLVARHAIFRTSFVTKDDEPVQRISEAVDFNVEVLDAPVPVETLIRPFDLACPPLVRVAVTEDGESGDRLLLVDIHHIAGDGVSLENLVREFAILYSGGTLDELPLQYRDFAVWQQESRMGMGKQAAYWTRQFSGEVPVLQLPTDYPRQRSGARSGDSVAFDIPSDLYCNLEELALNLNATFFMLLLAAFGIVLSKLSGQEEVVVATPAAGRNHTCLQPLVGMFVNTLPLRIHVKEELPFDNFCANVRELALSAFANQEFPFEDLVELVDVERDTSRNPLFDVMLLLQNIGDGNGDRRFELLPGNIRVCDYRNKTAKFDLTMTGFPQRDRLSFKLQFRTDLYKKETVEVLAEYFKRILAVVAVEPGIAVGDIRMLEDGALAKVMTRLNDTDTNHPRNDTLIKIFQRLAAQAPDVPALVDCHDDSLFTYGELDRMAGCVCRGLRAMGIGGGQVVGLSTLRSGLTIAGILGILKAGAAYMPVDPYYPEERSRFMMSDCGAPLLLANRDIAAFLQDEYVDLLGAPGDASDASDPAYVIYTSGTTGRPKGVLVEHRQAVNTVFWFIGNYELKRGVRVLQMSDLTFDPSINQVFGTLLSGGTLVMVDKETLTDTGRLRRRIARHQVEVLNFVPQLLSQLLGDEQKLASVRLVLSGGEALTEVVKEKILSRGYRLFNQYGPTEATIDALVEECSTRKIAIGRPIDNTHVYIVDRVGRLTEPLVAGELYIAGAGVARGYLNRPELTAERFVRFTPTEGSDAVLCYRTGDLARILPDGRVEFLGRIDRQVKIRGFRVELAEIENHLLAFPGISEAVVVARSCGEGGGALAAYVVLLEATDIRCIQEFMAGRLPEYMVPSHIQALERLPRNQRGKVDVKALPELDFGAGDSNLPPQTFTEISLARMWSAVLAAPEEKIGKFSDFFGLGGHSLKAMTMIARIKKEMGVKITLKELFANSALYRMARVIAGRKPRCSDCDSLQPVEKRAYYPLSPAQRRLYILQRMEPDSTVYNIPEWIVPGEPVCVERLKKVLDVLTRRHSGLRTSFHMKDGEPVQRVHQDVCLQVELLQLPAAGFIRPFDLASAPSLRVGVLQDADGNDVIVLDIHHIVCDGVSMQTLLREFNELYLHPAAALPALTLQYHDFCVWRQSPAAQNMAGRQEAFWLEEFSGDLPVLELPLDFQRPNIQKFDGGSVTLALDSQKTSALATLAKENGVTLYTVLLAIFSRWLAHLSGQEDMVVGTPAAGRGHADLEHLVGMFVNTLALRIKPEAHLTFIDFLRALGEKTIRAFDHQDFPFEDLVDRLPVGRNAGRNPLFDVMFGFQISGSHEASFRSEFVLGNPVSRFDLSLNCLERHGELVCFFEYATALFKEESVLRYVGHLECCVDSILENPFATLSDVEAMPSAERRRLLSEFNNTDVDYDLPINLWDLLVNKAQTTPDAVALVEPGRNARVTYLEIVQAAEGLAFRLEEYGVEARNIVAFSLERSIELVIAIFGILKTGAAYLPLDPAYPSQRVSYILADSGAKLVLSDSPREHTFPGKPLLNVGDCINRKIQAGISRAARMTGLGRSGDPAYVIYTSGSTGQPKGVLVEHSTAVNLICALQEAFPLRPGDVYLFKTAVVFDVSVSEIFGWIPGGATLAILPPGQEKDPEALIDAIRQYGATHVNFVPSMFQAFCESLKRLHSVTFERLRYVFLAGEALAPALVAMARPLLDGVLLENLYGPTEATVYASRYTLRDWDERNNVPVPIGTPLPNVRLFVLGRQLELKGIGIPGELCIAGEGLARGYLNRPELTGRQFVCVEGIDAEDASLPVLVYRTGDLVRMLSDGNIEFLGRIDNQVKIRGFRIELGEIESRLLRHGSVVEATVVAHCDSVRGPYLCAYVVPGDDGCDEKTLREYVKGCLPNYMAPAYFIELNEFPRTVSGKIDKKSLPLPGCQAETNSQVTEPENPTQRDLCLIWQKILNHSGFWIHDNFFDLGGNSLLLLKMHAAIEERFHGAIRVVDLFNLPSVAAIAAFIDNRYTAEEKIVAPPLPQLPETYFVAPGVMRQPDFLAFTVIGGVFRQLKDKAGSKGIRLEDMLLGIYIYLFSEITQQDMIEIPVVVRSRNRIDHLAMDLSKVDSIVNLFELVRDTLDRSECRAAADAKPIWDTGGIVSDRQVRMVFYLKKFLRSAGNLTERADLALEVEEKADRINFCCEYSGRLKEEKVEEIISMYVEMLGAVAKSLDDDGNAQA